MSEDREVIILNRDIVAFMIPLGVPIRVLQGTEVTMVQNLGGSFTVNVSGNLVRIESRDADSLGQIVKNPLDDLPENATIKNKIWTQLCTIFDPEIPVNIVDLGLVYDCNIEKHADLYFVTIEMTLTAPGCGMGPILVEDLKRKILMISNISKVEVELVFDPPWDRSMMSDTAKLQLGLF